MRIMTEENSRTDCFELYQRFGVDRFIRLPHVVQITEVEEQGISIQSILWYVIKLIMTWRLDSAVFKDWVLKYVCCTYKQVTRHQIKHI
jgi:hypothetical protein